MTTFITVEVPLGGYAVILDSHGTAMHTYSEESETKRIADSTDSADCECDDPLNCGKTHKIEIPSESKPLSPVAAAVARSIEARSKQIPENMRFVDPESW